MKKLLFLLAILTFGIFTATYLASPAQAAGDCTIANFQGSPASPVALGTTVRFSADYTCPSGVDSVTYVVRSSVVKDGIWDTNGFTFGPGTYSVTIRVVAKDDPNGMLPTYATLEYVVNGGSTSRSISTTPGTTRSSRVPSAPIMGSRVQTAVESIQAILPGYNIRIRNGASLQAKQIGVLPQGWFIPFADAISNGWYQIRLADSSLAWITADTSLTRPVK